MTLKSTLQRTVKSLRGQISRRLPMNDALSIRLRSLFTIGEFIAAHPTDAWSSSRGPRRPGFGRMHLFFRHVHTKHNGRSRDPGKLRPEWFSHERCFENLLSTLERSPNADRVTLTIFYDGTEQEFATDFLSRHTTRTAPPKIEVKLVQAGSNLKSWLELLDLVKGDAIPNDDIVFFVENDYLFVDGWLDKVIDLYESPTQFDYVTLYDHTDFYDLPEKPSFPAYRGLTAHLFVARSHHWRDAPSTCGTFIVQKRVLLEDLEVWRSRLSDFYAFTYLRTVKRRVLVSPVPGLSTHCMEGFLAPTVEWSPR